MAITISLTLAGGGMSLSPQGVQAQQDQRDEFPGRLNGGGTHAQEDSPNEFPGRLNGGGTHVQEDSPNEFPGRRVGGGTRGGCWRGPRPLLALNPPHNLGVSAAENPTLYFVLPSLRQSQEVEFLLLDEQQNSIYEYIGRVEPDQSMLAVEVPGEHLTPNQPRQWYFAVICDRENPAQDLVVDGWLQRVDQEIPLPSTSRTLATELQRLKTYQDQGLWTDAIALGVQLRQAYPQDPAVQTEWEALITALEFGIFRSVLP
ncbi:DUF928 domain-containing protein [Spirulina sp. CCNP1310]|nr:DUF928 domain-containing protein [Spirulina sp. CCNP1310]